MADDNEITYGFYVSPVGVLKIEVSETGICAIRFLGEMGLSQEDLPIPSHFLLEQCGSFDADN